MLLTGMRLNVLRMTWQERDLQLEDNSCGPDMQAQHETVFQHGVFQRCNCMVRSYVHTITRLLTEEYRTRLAPGNDAAVGMLPVKERAAFRDGCVLARVEGGGRFRHGSLQLLVASVGSSESPPGNYTEQRPKTRPTTPRLPAGIRPFTPHASPTAFAARIHPRPALVLISRHPPTPPS